MLTALLTSGLWVKQNFEMEPALNPDLKWALYCKGRACSPYEMAIALVENAIANG